MEQEKWAKANTIKSGITMLEGKRDALKEAWKAYRTNTKGYCAEDALKKFIKHLTDSFDGELSIDNIVDSICEEYDKRIAKLNKEFDEL